MRDNHHLLHIRISTVCLDILVADSRFLREQVERPLDNALEQIAEHTISSIMNREDGPSKRLGEQIHVLLQIISRNAAPIQEEPSLRRVLLMLRNQIRVRRRLTPNPTRPLQRVANQMQQDLSPDKNGDTHRTRQEHEQRHAEEDEEDPEDGRKSQEPDAEDVLPVAHVEFVRGVGGVERHYNAGEEREHGDAGPDVAEEQEEWAMPDCFGDGDT